MRAWDQQDVGRPLQQPSERDLHRCRLQPNAAAAYSVDDCSGENPPSGKNGVKAMPWLAKSSISASSRDTPGCSDSARTRCR